MTIFIRVDASSEIGTGHVMRCLTLAKRLKKQNKIVKFICREAKGDCIRLIQREDFEVYILPPVHQSLWSYTMKHWIEDAQQTIKIIEKHKVEMVIVDHYSIDEKWELHVRPYTNEIMIIDDLANRKHNCDILLDQNFYLNMKSRYDGLVPKNAQLLLGPKNVLLRDEFLDARNRKKIFNGKIERIFVFFGGSDPTNETEKVLKSLEYLVSKYLINVDVVVGESNLNKKRIEDICSPNKFFHFYCQVQNISDLMASADLAIGAGGATTWERLFLNLPSLVIAVAENQKEILETLASKNYVIYLGENEYVSHSQIEKKLDNLILNSGEIEDLLLKGNELFE